MSEKYKFTQLLCHGQDSRSVFKRSTAGFAEEFSFKTDSLLRLKNPVLLIYS